MMGPPVLPRAQHELLGVSGVGGVGVNGMQGGVNGMGMVNGLSRQPSASDLAMRSAAGTPGVGAGVNAAGLSINTNIGLAGLSNQQMAAMLSGTPTSASPNPALLGMVDGGAPRQSSQPPGGGAGGGGGSPFPGMNMGMGVGLQGMERKISGQGLLAQVWTPRHRRRQ